jgi:hypothetical protein
LLSSNFGRGGNPTRPFGVTNERADGARANAAAGGDVLRSEVGEGCLVTVVNGGSRAERSRGRAGVEALAETGTSGMSEDVSTSCGRVMTPLEGLRWTVTMVAKSMLSSVSESVSESLRYFAI